MTDWISAPALRTNLILISPKFLSILQKFKIDDYQTFKVKVKTNEGLKDYILFYMYSPERESEYIDWHKTTFAIRPYMNASMNENDQIVKFESYRNYRKLRIELFDKPKQVQEVWLTNLKLETEQIDKEMFNFNFLCSGFFITEKLKLEIEEQGITGIRFREADGLKEPDLSPALNE